MIVSDENPQYLYQQVIELVLSMEKSGALIPGDKLPSLRKLSRRVGVSIPTVKQAYIELERLNKIESRPKSGYFLINKIPKIGQPKTTIFEDCPVEVRCQTLIEKSYQAVHLPEMIPLGISHPVMACPPDKTLARIMRRILSQSGPKVMAYGPMDGYLPLKKYLAQRYNQQGIAARASDIVITNGAQEALAIALQSVAKLGDIIAVESPTYFGILELIENLGMMALEIPTCSEKGVCLEAVERSLKNNNVTACIFSSLINNPTGSIMPEKNRKKLVQLIEEKGVHLIEDGVYEELHFDDRVVRSLQAYSTKGLVLTCNSVSKTIAPSYRVGWLLSHRYEQVAKGLKRALSCSSSLLNQYVVLDYLRSGEYHRNIKKLRQILRRNKERAISLIATYFPTNTLMSNPQGGGVIWVELPNEASAEELFYAGVKAGISITPGILFSPSNKYQSCARISYGLPWDDKVDEAIKRLGQLAHQL